MKGINAARAGTREGSEAGGIFRKTILPNGVRIVSESIPSVRSVSVGAWVFSGSRDENRKQQGIHHFVEHMVFKGTTTRKMHLIAKRMESVGGFLNAFTGKEYTCYFARALDSHLTRSVETVTDLILSPTFPEKEIEKEKEVVLEEMKMYEDAPEDNIFDVFESVVYSGHGLAHPVLGIPKTVNNFSRDDLQSFVDSKYIPSRIVVAAAGNVDHDQLVGYVENAFEKRERANKPFRRRKANGYSIQHVEVARPVQQAHLVLGGRGCSTFDEDRLAFVVLNILLGGGMSSRLNQNIREKYGYCYSIYSFLNFHSDTGDFGIYTATEPSRIERTKDLIFRELKKLQKTPVGPRALNQARNQVKGSIMLGLESMSNRMMRLGKQELYFKKYVDLDRVINSVDSITEEKVQSVARRYLDPETLSSVILKPENKN